jgi:hypothetical protein
LLHNGILVHELKNEKKDLQKRQPIKFESLSDLEKSSLGDFTLPISTIVNKESYYKHLSISSSIRAELSKIIEDRNKLHLLDSLNISYAKSRALLLQEMKDYVDTIVEKLKNLQGS